MIFLITPEFYPKINSVANTPIDFSSLLNYNIFMKKIFIFLAISAVLAINLYFGLPRLARYSAVDEPYWTYDRTPQFWNAIKSFQWRSTNINDKPGITAALISGAGLLSIDPLPYKSPRQEVKTEALAKTYDKINFSFRLPIYLACLVLLLGFFWLLRKLFNDFTAVVATIFIGLSPIILGISLFVNPDSLLWAFMPLSIISYLVYQKDGKKRYLILTGILLGLSLLTKYVANILYVYFLGLIFLDYIYIFSEKETFHHYIKRALADFGSIIFLSLATFFVLFPATWLHPEMVLQGTILSQAFQSTWPIFAGFIGAILAETLLFKNKLSSWMMKWIVRYRDYLKSAIGGFFILGIIFVLLNVYSGMKVFNFEAEMASPKGGSHYSLMDYIFKTSADLYALLFALTPLTFILFCWAIFKNTVRKNLQREESVWILYSLIFIALYYLASTVNHVTATVRYQIILYPMVLIISAIGLADFINAQRLKKYFPSYVILILAVIICSLDLYWVKPFYFSYASPLLPQKYVLNLKDMGDGGYETAQFLNRLPGAQNIIIWSDKGVVCETFVGRCITGFRKNDLAGVNFNYLVVSTGRKSKSLKTNSLLDDLFDMKKVYSSDYPCVFKIEMGGQPNNFVKIAKTEDIRK
jgi:4-amino-4-deoxy-L-arabinose transferase-like glycosyltransferase